MERERIPIVGIGASAGGLDALQKLFTRIPPDTGMGFVVVQHLDPRQTSHLPELLSAATRLEVVVATDGQVVSPNKVYVLPPGKSILCSLGTLRIADRNSHEMVPQPINFFLQSLANERQHLAIGVVLSGTGTDGTLGVAEIKSVGGLTFAQDPESAQFPGMPLSAIQSGHVDYIYPPEKIAEELAHVAGHPMIGPEPAQNEPETALSEPSILDEYEDLLKILEAATQVDFSQYRSSTLRRRIRRRMVIRKFEILVEYVAFLKKEPAEVEALFRDLLINVTSFFRDRPMFESLKQLVLPELLALKGRKEPIRIWVVGCATGQETYSMAITFMEYLSTKSRVHPIQIFASDISEPYALNVARAGLYPESIASEVTEEQLQRYFTPEAGGYRINKTIRDMCIFARQNVIADPPFARLDLISCRNVLIYLSPALQKTVIPTFHYALNIPGYLVLGPSESVGTYTDLFSVVDREHRIYSRTAKDSRGLVPFKYFPPPSRNAPRTISPEPATSTRVDLQAEVDRTLIQKYVPGGVLINSDLEILQFRGRTSPWLEPPQAGSKLSIKAMASQRLVQEIQHAVREVQASGHRVSRPNVVFADNPRELVNLDVLPIRPQGTAMDSFMVLFDPPREPPPAAKPSVGDGAEQPALDNLRQELKSAQDYIQIVNDRNDASMEELRAANEEVMSANEELQSTNEELQTAKEELHSTNEELCTVNQEVQTRNYELAKLADDLLNLLSSLRIPIVMLSSDLRIRRFTPGTARFFNLLTTDIGRPITDIRPVFDMQPLGPLIENVIADVTPFEQEICDPQGRWHLLRIHPYRTAENKIDGAVLMLLDIDASRTEFQKPKVAAEYTAAIVAALHDPLLVLDGQLRVALASRSYCTSFGCNPAELKGESIFHLHQGAWNKPDVREFLTRVDLKDSEGKDFNVTFDVPGRGRLCFALCARPLDLPDMPKRVLIVMHDITDLKFAAD